MDNGVTVAFGATRSGSAGGVSVGVAVAAGTTNKAVTVDNPTGQNIAVTLDLSQHMTNGSVDTTELAVSAAHEGTHVSQGTALIGALPMDLTSAGAASVLAGPLNLTKYNSEFQAFTTSALVAQGLSKASLKVGGNYELWNIGWNAADRQTLRSVGINNALANAPYQVTPSAPGSKLIQ